jgi:RNA polymerase sigma factor (sigma-70 family)
MTSRALIETIADPTDTVAVDEVVRGNREMFEVLVRRHNQRLYRVGMSYLRDHVQTEDAMQNAYFKAFLNLQRFNRTASFATWITRIMINECLMILRRPQRRFEEADELRAANEVDAALPPADAQLARTEMKHLLENAIVELPENYRAVYMLREIQQLSTADTAASLGLSVESVKVNLHRARERLKTILLNTAAGAELFEYRAEFCDPMTRRVMTALLVH